MVVVVGVLNVQVILVASTLHDLLAVSKPLREFRMLDALYP